MENKISVVNPLQFRNTVGAELADMFDVHGISNYAELLQIPDLRSQKKLSKKTIQYAAELLDNEDVVQYLLDFQSTYQQEEPRYRENYRQAKQTYNKLKSVIPMLRDEFTSGFDCLEDILDFFDASSESEVFSEAEQVAVLFRQQNAVAVDPINLKAWLRRGELDFERLELPEYNQELLRQWIDAGEWRNHLEDVDYFKSLPDIFKSYGVALILIPFLPKTVYGAVRWINGHPLVQVSDRNQDLATCWFTLFHELGHVLLHKDNDVFEGEINNNKTAKTKIEREANSFANTYLFNGDSLRKEVFDLVHKREDITPFVLARKYNVNRIFVAYWLRKAQYRPGLQRQIHIDFGSPM